MNVCRTFATAGNLAIISCMLSAQLQVLTISVISLHSDSERMFPRPCPCRETFLLIPILPGFQAHVME